MNRRSMHIPFTESDGADRIIESGRNPRIKYALKLRRRSHRDKEGLMLIEGRAELKLALENGLRPIMLYYCPEFCKDPRDSDMIGQCRDLGSELFNCSSSVFRKMAYRAQPEGPIAVAPKVGRSLGQLPVSANPLIIVTESIEKPGNLGAVLRSVDASGADAVIVCGHSTDTCNPNVVRASIGTLFSVPLASTSSENALTWLRKNDIRIAAATPDAETEYTEADLRNGVAIVVGGEHGGLSGLWMNEADLKIRIPMRGQADSLNVAAATTVLLFEAVRQRKQ